jgi:hypothetical protein
MLLISFFYFFWFKISPPPHHEQKFKHNSGCLKVKATDSAGGDGETFGEVCSWHKYEDNTLSH